MNTLNLVLIISPLVTLALGLSIFLLLRTFFLGGISYAELSERRDLSWRHYGPLQRLLDPGEFQFLRDRGISEGKIRKLKAERRKIFRLYLRSLAQEFNGVYQALTLLLVQSEVDRPDLAAELAKQSIAFYRNLSRVEVYLAFHACGFERMPSIDLLQPLEGLSGQLRALMPANVAVC